MLKPVVNENMEKIPSRYSMVIGVAKRARQIVDAAIEAKEPLEEKPVGLAVQELMEGKFEVVQTEPEEEAPVVEASEAATEE